MSWGQKTVSTAYKACLLFVIISVALACSRKKDTWLSRNFHAMGAYYNILFHGDEALDNGIKQLHQNYTDNYWKILPIERIQRREDSTKYGEMVSSIAKNALNQEEVATNNPNNPQNAFSNFKNPNRNNNFNSNPNYNNFNNSGRNYNNAAYSQNQNGYANSYNNNGYNTYNNNSYGYNSMGSRYNNGRQYENNTVNNYGRSNAYGNSYGNAYGGVRQNYGNSEYAYTGPDAGGIRGYSRGFRIGPSNLDGFDLNTTTVDQKFNRAEEKATKAIQKHSMLINGVEHNTQMGHAFLLLGKARYYDQRYFPALEAFNYTARKFNNESLIATARVWAEKVYLRLGDNERVAKNIETLLSGKYIPKSDTLKALSVTVQNYLNQGNLPATLHAFTWYYVDTAKIADALQHAYFKPETVVKASEALAQAYLNQRQEEEALVPLNLAIHTTKDKKKKGRLLYIKGQIFEKLGKVDSARTAFNDVIDLRRRSPRIYWIHAQMEKARLFDYQKKDAEVLLKRLKKLQKTHENRPYLDLIDYQLAAYYKKLDSMPQAVVYYNQALRTGTQDHGLLARIYRTLGNYNFEQAQYKTAAAYYDSTMVNLPASSLVYYKTRRRRLGLNEVIKYEDIATRNDSILYLVHLTPEERETYFQNYVDSMKTQAIAQIKQEKNKQRSASLKQTVARRQGNRSGFYFYNPTRVAMGLATFHQIWGNRSLQDNWRSEAGFIATNDTTKEQNSSAEGVMATIANNPAFKVQTYLDKIPEKRKEIDSLTKERNFAYYQLGIIYETRFNKHALAAQKLESLLQNQPEQQLILPAKYNLYKIYSAQGDKVKAQRWKDDILTNYPDSRYAKILRNPQSLRESVNNPEQIYAALYKQYEAGKYAIVLKKCEHYITQLNGAPVMPKLALLKATITGRLYGLKAYEKALNFVALTYPQSKEGKKAQKLVDETIPKLQETTFDKAVAGRYELVYTVASSARKTALIKQEKLDRFIEKMELKAQLHTSVDVYTPQQLFVVVWGFHTREEVDHFKEKLTKEKILQHKKGSFVISSKNYGVLLMHKNLAEYLKEFN